MTDAQYQSYLAGKCRCAVCGQPGALQVFELTERELAELDWTDLRAFCDGCADIGRQLIRDGEVECDSGASHHSRFATIKAAIKKRRFGEHHISGKEIAKLQGANNKPPPPLVVPCPSPFEPPSVDQMVAFGAAHGISAEDCEDMHGRWEAKQWKGKHRWRTLLLHYQREGWLPSQKKLPAATKQLPVNQPDGIQMVDCGDLVIAVAINEKAKSELRRRLSMPL